MTLQNNLSAKDVKNGANLLGEWFLKGLGTVGKVITAPFTLTGPTSATIYKSKELLAKERTIDLKSEELLGKAMTWISPLNYGAAVATGNGLNARKGEEVVSSWSPFWQAIGRGTELYIGPKAIKGVKKAPSVINKTSKGLTNPKYSRLQLSNGKIRLLLPSHTESAPRLFVLEPLGNNKFYVHMRTWDGDKVPAKMSSAEKNTLFEALYNELPDGAEILFPQSGPGNYGTRGTVAGLLRLSRDSRFKPGTPGTLYYKGKNNEILTYQGTSFIKKPLSELSKTTNIANSKNLNILGSYTYRTPSSDAKTIDFLKEFFNRLKIQGLEYTIDGLKLSSKNVLIGLPENIKNYLNENTIERNARAMRLAGYSEREIQMYKDKVNEEISKIRVGLYSEEDYNAANSGDFGGFFNDEGSFISVNKDAYLKDPKFTSDYVMKHEGRHLIDHRTGMVDKLNKILEEAYDDDFLNIPNHEDAGPLKGYEHMNRERVTTNRDARDILLSSKGKILLNEHDFMLYASKNGLSNSMVDFLNKIIKYAQPEDIVNAVENSNGYGKRYIKYLRENNKLTPEKIELLRQAMIHVGGYAAPIVGGIYTLYNQNNNQLLEYRKQGGKMNILEFLKNGGQIRKMQTAAGGALQLTPEELKYYSWINMSPELRRQNRNNRVKAYLLSAPSIGNFWEALLTYIGNRDPKNPHLNAGEAPNASRAINPKLVAQAVLTAGKIVDKAKKYITLTKESTKMLNYPRIGQRYSKSLDIMSDFNPISDLLHLRLPDFTHSSLGLGNKYRAIGGRKALKSIVENGVVAPKGLFSREGKVFWNDGYLDRTYSGRGIFALSYDKTGKAPFYSGGRANSNYIYSSHENPIDFYDEALGLHARIPFTSTYVEIPKTLEGIDKALKMDKIHRYVEKPVHKLYNWGLKPYLGYKLWEHFENKGKEIEDKSKEEKEPLYEYYPYKKGGKIHIKEKNKGKFTSYCGGKVTSACIAKAKASGNKTLIKRATFAANARKWNH